MLLKNTYIHYFLSTILGNFILVEQVHLSVRYFTGLVNKNDESTKQNLKF